MKTPYVIALTWIIFIPTSGNKAQIEGKTSNMTIDVFQGYANNRELILSPPQFSNDSTRVIFLFFVAFVAMVSIASSSLVIHVVRVNQHMRSTTNYFIVNMAVADLLVTILIASTTMKVLYSGFHWSSGIIGLVTCKGVFFFSTSGLFCSVFSLVAITFDRFMAVSRPITYKYSSRWTKYIIPAVWIASLATPSRLIFTKLQLRNDFGPNNKTYCFVVEDAVDQGIISVVFGFIAPHVAMVIMYSMIAYKLWTRRIPGDQGNAQRQNAVQQTAKKVTRMIICVVLVFDICMAPAFTVFAAPYYFGDASFIYTSFCPSIFSMLSNSNGFLNALVYAFFNENYRRAFSDALGLQRIRHWLRKKSVRIRNFVRERKSTAKFTVTQPN